MRRVETCDALHRNMSGSKALVVSGGAGGDSRKGACMHWTSKGSCPRRSDCHSPMIPTQELLTGRAKGMRLTRTMATHRPTFSGMGLTSEASLSLFGAAVEYKPASFREKSASQKFSPRTVHGIFAGYHSGRDWSGDYYVYDEDALRSAAAWHRALASGPRGRFAGRKRVHIPREG